MKRKCVLIGVALCAMLSLLCSCSLSEREYKEDIVVELPDRDGVVIIREWSYLLGSGAQVRYKYGWRPPILLGQTSGSDNGYCPFEAGEYRITQKGNALELSWRFNGTGRWRSQSFSLPDEGLLRRQTFVVVTKTGVLLLALGVGTVWLVRRRRKKAKTEE